MKILKILVMTNYMDFFEKMIDSNLKKLFLFLWSSFLLGATLVSIIYFYEISIAGNTYLMLLVLLVCLPIGITHLYLLGDIVKVYKYKLLLVLPLLIAPRLFLVFVIFGPYLYLFYITTLWLRLQKRS